ncbi:MAG TPA: tetratricopeptide repeat protein [Terracidiphilus sp.]|jgi:TolB-like protein/DNA-binding winged helix-turn-helix (wHTH) protein/Flp pilus assembly protein TadD
MSQRSPAVVNRSEAVKAEFADFKLDLASGELDRSGHLVRLQGQPFLVLCVLLDHAREVVTREELQRQLWPDDTLVDFDHGLNKAIAKLRDALDDSKSTAALIQTLPRRGYRFMAEVNWVGPRIASPTLEAPVVLRSSISVRYRFGGAIVLAMLLMTTLWINRYAIEDWFQPRPVIRSVAVLPLTNLSNDPEQEYLTDGISEDLITDLSYTKSLRVIPLTSTRRFKDSLLSVPQIADQLSVDALIGGTVLRANDTIRITIHLMAAKPERQLWAASYERNIRNVEQLQTQIAADAVAQIRTQLTSEERDRLKLESRIDPEAYDDYLRARYFLSQEKQEDKAIPHLERAIRLDPNFVAAYAALGEAWGIDGVWGEIGNREASAKALKYSEQAVSLDPNSSEACTSLGHSLMQAHRWNDGETALRRAIQIDPNNFRAMEYLSILLAQKARTDEGVTLARKAAIANPVAVDLQRIYGLMLFRARRYDEAITQLESAIHLDPNHLTLYGTFASALVEKGRYQEAEDALRKGKVVDPGRWAWLYLREGNPAAARQLLKENPSQADPYAAVTRYLLGEQEAGLTQLDYLANVEWETKTYNLRNDPMFDPLRIDPRFTAIVKKTGLMDN